MAFLQATVLDHKVFDEMPFPKTLLPSSPDAAGVDDLVTAVEANRASLAETLRSHGAILFRGFNVSSAEEFERIVAAFGWEAMEHLGATTRIKMTDRVYTANESPVDQLINFHHEMSLMKQSPSKIFFFCSQPSPEGGETSIVRSDIIREKMEEQFPDVMKKISQVGLIFMSGTPKDSEADSGKFLNKTWKWFFKTDNEAVADKMAREVLNCNSVTFNPDGSADFVFGPFNPIRESGEKKAWFMPFLSYTDNPKDVKSTYGDGTAIPEETKTVYADIVEENCVDVKWEKGDVLLVDNHTVQHARRPGKPPRVILVSVCK